MFPSVSPVFFQIGTVTYQHHLRFRWRRFMYEFLPLIRRGRSVFELCESMVDVTQRQTETKVGMIDSAALV